MTNNFDIHRDFVKEMFTEDDDEYEKYRLHLFNKLHGEGSSSTPRRTIYRDREAGHEHERDTYATPFGPLPSYDDTTNGIPQPNLGEEPFIPYQNYVKKTAQIRDRQKYRQLQTDLVEHISQFHATRQNI
ncbi:hypothetical protein POM88_013061 [Heracleum sosnowskyi]|uniref:Uncharacterized protein n=1 Tax=Heracleum sosnowskyi TaxID=360622 RepID=A0AAD8MXS6_9APIA|nr:hypothetical protein POM88_013061 [Heracleum sosnowskyi]